MSSTDKMHEVNGVGFLSPSNSDVLLKVSLFVDNQRELCCSPDS